MTNEACPERSERDGSLVLVFNGEIYNFRELRADLVKRGHRLKTRSDTEVILHLYEDEGEDCLHRLRGMFAFALWDRKERKLLLARDRIGIKPLYYLVHGDTLLFASELKALLCFQGWERALDPAALLQYLTFLYIPTPATIFKAVRKLEAGHRLIFQEGRVRIEPYWDLPFPEDRLRDEREVVERCRALLLETVRLHLESDVPVGVFLSGGMDSSSLVALTAQILREPVRTFTLGFEEASFTEFPYARRVAEHFSTRHREEVVKPEVMALLPTLIWHLDEPLADASLLLTYLVSTMAKSEVKVALSGIGGDELFGGYPRYLGVKLLPFYHRLPLSLRRGMARFASALPESMTSTNVPGRIKRFLKAGVLPPDRRYLAWVSFVSEDLEAALLSEPLISWLSSFDPTHRHLRYLTRHEGLDPLDRILYLDLKTYLADDLLMLADKMSMASSLELRVPFADHRLLEFVAAIPAELRIEGFRLKSLLKRVMAPFLPPEILRRPKRGFTPPLARWLQGKLQPMVEELLSERVIRKRGYFRPEGIRWLLAQHTSGRQNLFDQLFALLVLELWHRVVLEGGGR